MTGIDRIPLAHSVRYVAHGLPEVPNHYGPGVLAPSEITLTYRAAPDSQLGRVHAYVAGRLWVDGKEVPLLPGGLYGQHYLDGLDNWPEWLAEEARLHDPEAAAVSAAVAPPTDPTHGLSVQHADALYDAIATPGPARESFDDQHARVCAVVRQILDDLLPTPAEPTDRAAVLHEVADELTRKANKLTERVHDLAYFVAKDRLREAEILDREATELRRMADQTATETPKEQ
ncbi:hypothetical protein ACPCSB_04700 [Streptomyces pseudogriseolus]|uniref:hypothetical protein n=1 Tax=Streptomyces pseudogriseolus TaxID=36817 RepID=UPI003FA20BCC